MKPPPQNTFRIIGGVHRGRRFQFPGDESVRPSPDRVRETVFNWLQPVISGSRCLDLFAGSGALGLEALSRGAAHVEFVDSVSRVIGAIRAHLAALRDEGRAAGHVADVGVFLRAAPVEPFDIVFLDPPYAAGLLQAACVALETGGWLSPDARIYLECAAKGGLPPLPANWEVVREKQAGQVGYFLALRKPANG